MAALVTSVTQNINDASDEAGEGGLWGTGGILTQLLNGGSPEMECFPNEGQVFNKKFYITYANRATEEFIDDSATFDPAANNTKYIPHKNAINKAVLDLKEHIKSLGGIEVTEVSDSNIKKSDNDDKEYLTTTIIDPSDFFDKNNNIDILITYVLDDAQDDAQKNKLRRITTNGNTNGPVTDKNKVLEGVFVAVKGESNYNAISFQEDYLNKDFNRYTHISIAGYMTDTQNKAMQAIMLLISLILGLTVLYFTIPNLYKIAIRKMLYGYNTCGNNFENYNMVIGFNYWFVIIFMLIPAIATFTFGTHGLLSGIFIISLVSLLTIKARDQIDKKYFYDFYPRNGLSDCNKNSSYIENFGSGYWEAIKKGPVAWRRVLAM